jgi:hypothetical protein
LLDHQETFAEHRAAKAESQPSGHPRDGKTIAKVKG